MNPELANTAEFNILGIPATTIPCGFNAKGVPVGLMIAGPAVGGRAGVGPGAPLPALHRLARAPSPAHSRDSRAGAQNDSEDKPKA